MKGASERKKERKRTDNNRLDLEAKHPIHVLIELSLSDFYR